MKYNELLKKLKQNGWEVVREGSNHTILGKGSIRIPIPRHASKEVPTGTYKAIMKQTGLK